MPTDGTPRSSYRLPCETLAKISAVADARGGLTATRVLVLAVDELHRQVCGRRAADTKPVRRRARAD